MSSKLSINPGQEKLAQKRFIFFLVGTKSCPLRFNERLVWSYLVKAERAKKSGLTRKEIAEWTGLSSTTTRHVVTDLVDLGLATNPHYRLTVANEPNEQTSDWWHRRTTKKDQPHWADRLAYFPIELSSPDNDPIKAAILGLLRSLAGKSHAAQGQSAAGLAKMLGSDYRTVGMRLRRLEEAKRIKTMGMSQNRFGKTDRFDVVLLSADNRDNLAPPSNDKPPAVSPNSDTDRFAAIRRDRKCMADLMANHHYPANVISDILHQCDRLPTDRTLDIFLANFDSAQQDHRQQQSAGKFVGINHSGHLLLHKIAGVVNRRRSEAESLAAEIAYFDKLSFSA